MDMFRYTYNMFSEKIDWINGDLTKVMYEDRLDFISVYFKYEPKYGDLYYEGIPRPKFITFGLIKLIQYPKELFMIWSDHEAGVYARCASNNKLEITSDTHSIYNLNPLKLNCYRCFYDSPPEYLTIQPNKPIIDIYNNSSLSLNINKISQSKDLWKQKYNSRIY